MRIRGFSSINSDREVLYVIDGVVGGSFSQLNPADVENITILKDAGSTALYGSKAVNGVILVTTKKGKKGFDKFTFTNSTGLSERGVEDYDRVGAKDYYELMWEANRNQLVTAGTALATANTTATNNLFANLGYNIYNVPNNQIVGTDGKLNPAASLKYDDFDWNGAIERVGLRRDYTFSYSGGNDKSDYYASLGYLNEKGYIVNSGLEKYTGRINVNSQLRPWFKTGINLATSKSTSNRSSATSGNTNAITNTVRFARYTAPIYPIFAHNQTTGEFLLDVFGNKIYDDGASNGAIRGSGGSPGRNPVFENLNDKRGRQVIDINARTYGLFNLTKNLTFTSNFGYDYRTLKDLDFQNPIIGDGAPDGRISLDETTTTNILTNQLLDYTKTFENGLKIKALIGYEETSVKIEELLASKSKLGLVPGSIEFSNFATITDLRSFKDEDKTKSYLSRLELDYNSKYFLSGSFRRDGSSRFSPDNRWGNFWSVGAAWKLDNETFISSQSWIDELKLRASTGLIGNNRVLTGGAANYYPYLGLYNLNNNGAESGFIVGSFSAADLKWESNYNSDVALEFGFLKRIKGSVEYYKRITKDLIFNIPAPISAGVDSYLKNIGEVSNSGIEVTLSGDVLKYKDIFNWNISINASTVKNEILSLPAETPEIISGTKKFIVGSSIYDYWLKEWAGVDPSDGSALFVAANVNAPTGIRVIDGKTLTIDQNNAKFHYNGSAIPDVFGSVSNTIRYKKFSLNAMLTYSFGGKLYDSNYQVLIHPGSYGRASASDILNRWQKPGDITDVPRLDAGKTSVFTATSDRFLVDADYLNLRQVQLTYDVSKKFLNKINLSEAKIYLSGENLWLKSERKGLDPQENFSGVNENVYSPARIYSLGINVTF